MYRFANKNIIASKESNIISGSDKRVITGEVLIHNVKRSVAVKLFKRIHLEDKQQIIRPDEDQIAAKMLREYGETNLLNEKFPDNFTRCFGIYNGERVYGLVVQRVFGKSVEDCDNFTAEHLQQILHIKSELEKQGILLGADMLNAENIMLGYTDDNDTIRPIFIDVRLKDESDDEEDWSNTSQDHINKLQSLVGKANS